LPALPRLTRTGEGFRCAEGCGASLPIRDGVVVVRDAPTDDNKIAANFYTSKLWPKVRFWERAFWLLNGGERRAREMVLRRLPTSPALRLLDVAIGDGVYARWLPKDWSIVGVDVSTAQLAACQRRNPDRGLRLVLCEAEELPFRDHEFDAVLSMGDDFAGLVERHRNIDVAEIGRRVLDDSRYEVIWRGGGGGYLMTRAAPCPEKPVQPAYDAAREPALLDA
jgi:hypothetical protein